MRITSNGRYSTENDIFQAIRFVSRAIGKDRWYLPCISVETSEKSVNLVATDGYRLHLAEFKADSVDLQGLTAGLYSVVKIGPKEAILEPYGDGDSEFPKWQQVVPDTEGVAVTASMNVNDPDVAAAFFARNLPPFKSATGAFEADQTVAHVALEAALQNGKPGSYVHAATAIIPLKASGPVVILRESTETATLKAVIMPKIV